MFSSELPQPKSGFLDQLRASNNDSSAPRHERPATPPSQKTPPQEPNSTRSRPSRRESLGALEADPWGSPEMHRNHNHESVATEDRIINAYGSMRSTTNAWTSAPVAETNQGHLPQPDHTNGRADTVVPSSAGSGWGGNIGAAVGHEPTFEGTQRPTVGGFGPPGDEPSGIARRRRSLGLGQSTNPQVEETVTITMLPEKEGLFMFKHRNYEVKSARRGSTVVRRYSDFVWLLDCLQKRFPFRQLPLIPPKRVAGTFHAG